MAQPVKKSTERRQTFKFSVDFDQKPEQTVEVVAYAFDARGRLAATNPLKGGQVELTLDAAALRGLRLYFAPPLEGEKRTPTLADMERLRAYQPVFELSPNQLNYQLLPIPVEIWKWWFKCKCRVRGKVVKPVPVDGVLVDKDVCEARVHICEVDKLWIPIFRLPDPLVLKLRDDLLKELQKPPRLPVVDPNVIPWPPPPPDPERLFSLPGEAVTFNPQPDPPGDPLARVALNPQPLPPRESLLSRVALNPQPLPPEPPDPLRLVALNPQPLPPAILTLRPSKFLEIVELNPQPEPPSPTNLRMASSAGADLATCQTAFEQLSSEVRSGLVATSVVTVRQALVANYKLILPYLCIWPWWIRYFCFCDEIAVLITDSQGRFDTTITYPCFGDHPDLYFWVEYGIDGVWTTVYHPNPVCCHTYWDYVCGTEVILRVTDPRVHWCEETPDLDGLNVVITTIGNGISMSEIQMAPGVNQGYTTDSEPFAGTLEMRMDLSRSNLIALGVDHYRWSYRRKTLGDALTPVSDIWHPMTHPVYRYYKTMVPNPTPPPLLKPFYPADPMGPDLAFPGQNLFRIQPENPPAPGIEWSFLNEHVDLAYAYFETGSLMESDGITYAAGKYEVKLELFNSSGALVNWSNPTGSTPANPIFPFISNNAAPFVPPVGMTTIPAPAANLITDISGNVLGYTMVLYVDNSHCGAYIYDTWVDTPSKAAGPCGFIEFDDRDTSLAHLACWAHEDFNHAMFLFRIDKGSSGDVPIATVGWDYVNNWAIYVPVGSPANGYSRDSASNFSKAILVKDLLDANGFNCAQAAFAETIYVYHIGVDGYTRAYWLDASATPKAFALSPGS